MVDAVKVMVKPASTNRGKEDESYVYDPEDYYCEEDYGGEAI